jgi:hypothetical protein
VSIISSDVGELNRADWLSALAPLQNGSEMPARRSLFERTRGAMDAWFPIDGSKVALLVFGALLAFMFAGLVH